MKCGHRIVKFGSVSLADTCGLLTSSGKKDLTRLEHHGETEVMGVGHWHGVPLAVFEVFRRWRGHKAVSVSSSHRQFTILALQASFGRTGIEQRMSGTGDVEVWQPLCLKFDNRACFLLLCHHRQRNT